MEDRPIEELVNTDGSEAIRIITAENSEIEQSPQSNNSAIAILALLAVSA